MNLEQFEKLYRAITDISAALSQRGKQTRLLANSLTIPRTELANSLGSAVLANECTAELVPVKKQRSCTIFDREEGKFGIAFNAVFDRGSSPTKLKVTCRISKTFTDEIESEVDPRQPELL